MPSSEYREMPIVAVGTTMGMKIYIPCRLFKRYEGTSFGGENGLYVSIDEQIEDIHGECIYLEASWDRTQARTLLNRLLPQAKVDDMLTQCWLREGETHEIRVFARIIERIKSQIKQTADQAASSSVEAYAV